MSTCIPARRWSDVAFSVQLTNQVVPEVIQSEKWVQKNQAAEIRRSVDSVGEPEKVKVIMTSLELMDRVMNSVIKLSSVPSYSLDVGVWYLRIHAHLCQ